MTDSRKISLSAPYGNWRNTLTNTSPEVREYHKNLQELERRLAAGEPCYVMFKDDRREGSIGKIVSCTMTIDKPNNSYHYNYSRFDTYVFRGLEVGWDDRKNVVKPYYSEIYWLPDHKDGTKWAYKKPEKREIVIPEIKDKLGEVIQVGNFVSFIYTRYGNIEMMYGTITRINENGSVWAKNMKLSSTDKSEERQIRHPQNIVIMEKNFMDKLLMFKLSLA